MENFNELSQKIYEQNKAVGWWDDPNRCIYQTLQLVSTEIAEATEGERKNLMDDKIPHRKMGEVELADALIRIFDLAGRYEWRYQSNAAPTPEVRDDRLSIGAKHLFLNSQLIALATRVQHHVERGAPLDSPLVSLDYSVFVRSVVVAAHSEGYDVMAALYEKLEYNAHRSDHKRENRAKEHGKKF